MTDTSGKPAMVFLNGDLIPVDEARVSFADAGLLYGAGFFETFRTSGGKSHHWDYHRARLEQACATAGIRLPEPSLAIDETRLREAIRRLLAYHECGDAVIRYTVTAGRTDSPGVEWLSLRSLPPEPPADGVVLRTLKLPRDSGEWLPRPKSLNYANAWLGGRELARRAAAGSDEGLFLSRDSGYVVETSRCNVAWIADGVLHFPDPALGAVAGTCLAWVLDRDIEARAVRANTEALRGADAVVVMNAVRGITPVRELCDAADRVVQSYPDAARHPIVTSLRWQWQESLEATAAR